MAVVAVLGTTMVPTTKVNPERAVDKQARGQKEQSGRMSCNIPELWQSAGGSRGPAVEQTVATVPHR